MYDTGSFDLFDPAHQPFIPPLANLIPSGVCDPHGARPRIPAGIRMLTNFLRAGRAGRELLQRTSATPASPTRSAAAQPSRAIRWTEGVKRERETLKTVKREA